MLILFKIFSQSLRLSFAEIRASKLRSFLSLLGISIGIFCIISVRTAVNSLEMNIANSLAQFGNDIIYVAKWPWLFQDDYPWWKFVNRPVTNRRELEQLAEKVKSAEALAIIYFAGEAKVVFEDREAEGISVNGVSYDYQRIRELDYSQGRYFTPSESNNAQPVCIVGANVVDALFDGVSQVEGKTLRIRGVRLTIVGVLKKEGDDIFGFSQDNNVLVPFSLMSNFVSMDGFSDNEPMIAVTPRKGVNVEELKYELKGAMRGIRKLSPQEDDNFALNQVSVVTEAIAGIFQMVNIAGFIIGIFSIIVGAFGIANIMFVSVKERTHIIGIKKAIGAQSGYILMEFLLEAIILCLLGGFAGLLLVVGIFKLLQLAITSSGSSFQFYITTTNVMIGISISVVVGILAGVIPAITAARMKPVDAMRSN